MFRGYPYIIIFILFVLACGEEEKDPFIADVDTSVTNEDIYGTWFVYAGEFKDNFVETTPNFSECGFDYIIFSESGTYQEIMYPNSDCVSNKNFANWNLENGIIRVFAENGESLDFPVVEFGPEELVINFQFDLNNDGDKEIFKAYLRPYNPIPNYYVTNTFFRDSNEDTLLKFNWKQDGNYNSFDSYKIYRSREGECSKEDAILLAEIKDISINTYVDYDPPTTQGNLCYFLKVYSNEGLVGESSLLNENPRELVIPNAVNLNTVRAEEDNVVLEWDNYNIPYFSHYEIVYANSNGSNRLFHEEGRITTIQELEQVSFLNANPPYLENPFFAIYSYNIFGTKVVSNYEQVLFRRKDLFGPINLGHIEVDDEEPVIYLHGSSKIPEWTNYNKSAVLRLNYDKGLIESTSENEVYVAGEFPFRKPMTFPSGSELVVNGRTNLHFLNPSSLTEIFSYPSFYLHEEFNLNGIIDFTYTRNGFFVIINSDYIFVFQRNGGLLNLLDKQVHYTTHHGDNLYRVLLVNDNEIIIGHKNEEQSIFYTVDINGLLHNRKVVPLPLSSSYISKYKNVSYYSDTSNTLINYGDRTLYSTFSFNSKTQMPQDLFALGLKKDGKYIFATTNNPDWFGSDVKTEFLKREILFFNTETSQITPIKTKGYPIVVFENYLGEICSLSIPENQSIIDFDVFVEQVDFP